MSRECRRPYKLLTMTALIRFMDATGCVEQPVAIKL